MESDVRKQLMLVITPLLGVLVSAHKELCRARREVSLMKQRLEYQVAKDDPEAETNEPEDGQTWSQRECRIKGHDFTDQDAAPSELVPPEAEPATQAQIALLKKEGVDYPPRLTRAQADQMIDALWCYEREDYY